MQRFQGRNASACYNCHRQKVKCTGEQPCQRCARRHQSCVYSPVQDSIIPVPETYLRNLDRSLKELTDAIRMQGFQNAGSISADSFWSQDRRSGTQFQPQPAYLVRRVAPDSLVEDSTSEAFIRRLREAVNLTECSTESVDNQATLDQQRNNHPAAAPRYHEPHNRSNILLRNKSFQLPPYSYASQLVARAEQEFGDCHTFLRKSFLRRFHATYSGHESETLDRNWLCRLFFVLALAECTTTTKRPIQLTPNGAVTESSPTDDSPPSEEMLFAGVELFEHGIALLNIPYEEPTVDDVEALNLASHCCYILNRRMSAYSYAGQAIRLAQFLGLDHPAAASLSKLEREHMKRVWWTAFCVDRMISTEFALRPSYTGLSQGLEYPDSSGLSPEEKEEFYDPDLLTALIKLCEIKYDVVNTVSQLKDKDIAEPYEVLGQCLQGLDRCGRDLPERVFSGCDSLPENRICSSLALRYHQCYILLLRPILLHQFTFMIQNETTITLSDELCTINSICLQAARSNARIMLELAQAGELVKYGYWDSAHLFSCLTVLAIAQPMFGRQSNAFQCTREDMSRDANTYNNARSVLVHMAHTGNMASKQHISMLEEVERYGTMLPASKSSTMEINLDFEDWVKLVSMSDQTPNRVESFISM